MWGPVGAFLCRTPVNRRPCGVQSRVSRRGNQTSGLNGTFRFLYDLSRHLAIVPSRRPSATRPPCPRPRSARSARGRAPWSAASRSPSWAKTSPKASRSRLRRPQPPPRASSPASSWRSTTPRPRVGGGRRGGRQPQRRLRHARGRIHLRDAARAGHRLDQPESSAPRRAGPR